MKTMLIKYLTNFKHRTNEGSIYLEVVLWACHCYSATYFYASHNANRDFQAHGLGDALYVVDGYCSSFRAGWFNADGYFCSPWQ